MKKRSKFSASRPHCRRKRRRREACDGSGVMNMIIKTEEKSKRTEQSDARRTNKVMTVDINAMNGIVEQFWM